MCAVRPHDAEHDGAAAVCIRSDTAVYADGLTKNDALCIAEDMQSAALGGGHILRDARREPAAEAASGQTDRVLARPLPEIRAALYFIRV